MPSINDRLRDIRASLPAVFEATLALYVASNGKGMVQEPLSLGKMQKILSLTKSSGRFDEFVSKILLEGFKHAEGDKPFTFIKNFLEKTNNLNLSTEEGREKYRKLAEEAKLGQLLVKISRPIITASIILMREGMILDRLPDNVQDKVIRFVYGKLISDNGEYPYDAVERALGSPITLGGGMVSLELDTEDADFVEQVLRKADLGDKAEDIITTLSSGDENWEEPVQNTVCTTVAYLKGVVYPFLVQVYSGLVLLSDDGLLVRSLVDYKEPKVETDNAPTLDKFDKAVRFDHKGKNVYVPINLVNGEVVLATEQNEEGLYSILAFTIDEEGNKHQYKLPYLDLDI